MHCMKYPYSEMLTDNFKRFLAVFMPLNEVCDNLLKGKHGCKLKYTNNLLFNKQQYLQKTYCIAWNSAYCYVAAWMGGEFTGE